MKINKWTQALLCAGLVSLPAVTQADEAPVVNSVLTSLSATTLSGYIDTSATWSFGTGDANVPGRTYDGPSTQDGFNMNVVSLTLDKPMDESEWASGYHVQMLMGPNAAARGTGLFGSSSTSEFSFNEAYVALRAPIGNGIDFKVGQFGTYNGYESFDTYKDPNWSRSYGFFIESSAHTGVSASYKFNDMFSLMAGVGNAAAYNNQVNVKQAYESRKAYLSMLTFTMPESFGFLKGGTVSAGYTFGDHQPSDTGTYSSGTPAGGTRWTQGNMYAGATLPMPITGLTLGLAYDYTYGQSSANDYANATALYVMYTMDKWKFNNRFDYATSTAGNFDNVVGNGGADELFSYTLTVDYTLWKNVISRAEFRWDHSCSGQEVYGGSTAGSPDEKNFTSITANIIYLF